MMQPPYVYELGMEHPADPDIVVTLTKSGYGTYKLVATRVETGEIRECHVAFGAIESGLRSLGRRIEKGRI